MIAEAQRTDILPAEKSPSIYPRCPPGWVWEPDAGTCLPTDFVAGKSEVEYLPIASLPARIHPSSDLRTKTPDTLQCGRNITNCRLTNTPSVNSVEPECPNFEYWHPKFKHCIPFLSTTGTGTSISFSSPRHRDFETLSPQPNATGQHALLDMFTSTLAL